MKLTRNSKIITELVGKFKYKDSNMSLMAWNDSFATHVGDVDSHHGKLIDLMNEICRGIMLEKKVTVDNTLDGLVDFIVMHFGYEEIMLPNIRREIPKPATNFYLF